MSQHKPTLEKPAKTPPPAAAQFAAGFNLGRPQRRDSAILGMEHHLLAQGS